MNYKIILFAFFYMCVSTSYAQTAQQSIILENFDSVTYGEWIKEGTAFDDGPSPGGEDAHHMVGFWGNGFAASLNSKNKTATGTLTSPPFVIERNSIHFLLGAHEVHFMPGSTEGRDNLAIQLIVENKVVQSTSPDEFHAMFWRGWDVAPLKGKTARIRIVDNDKRMWAHIDVDHIVLNDIPVEGLLTKRFMTVTGAKLNFPVNEKNGRYYVELWVNGKQIRGMDVALATEDIDYWVVTDLSQWQGKQIQIRTRQFAEHNPSLLDGITFADGILDSGDLYQESLRQQFHFSSKRGWLNDPNGLVYYTGEYHLFYQHNPFGWDHSRNDNNKTWGHAVSTDLVHWRELPGAVHPDHLGPIYSGSAVIDQNNTTGFQTGDEKPIVCIYTSAGGRSPWSKGKKFTQSLSYSNDRGRTFTTYAGNPVQENLDYINRDPKAIWHEPTKKWVFILHFDERAMVFFTSDDLKTWEKQSEFESPYLVDCPELFELPVDGDNNNKKWIIYGGSGAYYVGDFDGKRFTPETEVIQYSYGNCFYASQTFSNAPENRRVQMAWAVIPTPGMPFNMSMLFPVELTFRTTEDGTRLFAWPVQEIENIYGKEHSWNDIKLEPGQNILSDIKGGLYDINAGFNVSGADSFGFVINGLPVTYNSGKNLLSCGGEEAELVPVDGRIRLRILVDRVSVEIFANDGRIYMPVRVYPGPDDKAIKIFTKGGDTMVNTLKVRELKSIWQ